MTRADWYRACMVARTGGALRATVPNLVAAYRLVDERREWDDLAWPCEVDDNAQTWRPE